MKTLVTALAAGAVLSLAAAAADAGQYYRAKFGRPAPQEEARQRAVQRAQAAILDDCVEHGCCRRASHRAAMPAPRDADTRFLAKWGRGRDTAAPEKLAPAASAVEMAARQSAETEERYFRKFGRPTPTEEKRVAAARAKAEPVLLAAAPACCGRPDCAMSR